MFEEFVDKPRMQTKSEAPVFIGILLIFLLIVGIVAGSYLIDAIAGRQSPPTSPATHPAKARAPVKSSSTQERFKQDSKTDVPMDAPAKE